MTDNYTNDFKKQSFTTDNEINVDPTELTFTVPTHGRPPVGALIPMQDAANAAAIAGNVINNVSKGGVHAAVGVVAADLLKRGVIDPGVERIGEAVRNIGKGKKPAKSKPSHRNGNSGRGGGGGGSVGAPINTPSGPKQSRNVLAITVGSAPVDVNVGIRAPIVVNPMQGETAASDLVYCAGHSFDPTGFSTSLSDKNFQQIQVYRLISEAQKRVSYRVGLSSSVLADYFRVVSSALQMYYDINSILAYCSNPDVENVGMMNMRSWITSDILNEYQLMEERLHNCYIPTNILNWIRYMYQNFSMSDLPGAAITKITYGKNFHPKYTSNDLLDDIQEINGWLTAVTTTADAAVIAASFPDWRIGVLQPSAGIALYDKNFKSLWHNSAGTYFNRQVDGEDISYPHLYAPNVGASSSTLPYFSATNDLEGAHYQCATIFTFATSIYEPGLLMPAYIIPSGDVSDMANYTNRFKYNGNSAATIWDPVTSARAGFAWSYTNENGTATTWTSGTVTAPLGSQVCVNHSINQFPDGNYSFMDWLWMTSGM
jgi:hypothetical protein